LPGWYITYINKPKKQFHVVVLLVAGPTFLLCLQQTGGGEVQVEYEMIEKGGVAAVWLAVVACTPI